MRTVLDSKTLAFEEGFQAHQSGIPRSANPYPDGSTFRGIWFEGWDYAVQCSGGCE
jgi:ribosome modulation factor